MSKNIHISTYAADGGLCLMLSSAPDLKQSASAKSTPLHPHGSSSDGQKCQTSETCETFPLSNATFSQPVSPVRTFPQPDQKADSAAQGLLFGSLSEIALHDADPVFAWLKTQVQFRCEDLTACFPTWKRNTTQQGRLMWKLAHSERPTSAPEFSLLPTPLASDNRDRGDVSNPCIQRRMRIGKQIGLSMLFKGTPCPLCVAGMMGFPNQLARELINFLATQSVTPSPPLSPNQSTNS
jgi:hypothetical protein